MIARGSTQSSAQAQVTEKQVAYLLIIEIIFLFYDFHKLFLIYSFFLGRIIPSVRLNSILTIDTSSLIKLNG